MTARPIDHPWGRGELSLWRAVRFGTVAVLDDLRHFAAVNVPVAIAAGALALLVQRIPPAAPVLVVFVPVATGMARMAGVTVRGGGARLADFRAGVPHRFRAVLGLAVLFVAVAIVAAVNVAVVGGVTRLVPTIVLVLSIWVLAATFVLALAAWPLLGDPDRVELRVRDLVRLAATVVLARPVRMVGLAAFVLLLVALAAQTWVGWFLLPALGLAVAAHVVIPVADALAPGRGADIGPGRVAQAPADEQESS